MMMVAVVALVKLADVLRRDLHNVPEAVVVVAAVLRHLVVILVLLLLHLADDAAAGVVATGQQLQLWPAQHVVIEVHHGQQRLAAVVLHKPGVNFLHR